ncbi:hypothetical protein [Fusobacterium sp. THCT1E2]
MKNRIVTLDKEKIKELKLTKREVVIYTLISLLDGDYTVKQMCGILGVGFQLHQVVEYCENLKDKGLIKRNEEKFILT